MALIVALNNDLISTEVFAAIGAGNASNALIEIGMTELDPVGTDRRRSVFALPAGASLRAVTKHSIVAMSGGSAAAAVLSFIALKSFGTRDARVLRTITLIAGVVPVAVNPVVAGVSASWDSALASIGITNVLGAGVFVVLALSVADVEHSSDASDSTRVAVARDRITVAISGGFIAAACAHHSERGRECNGKQIE